MGLEDFLGGQPNTSGSGKEEKPVVKLSDSVSKMFEFYNNLRKDDDVGAELEELIRNKNHIKLDYNKVENIVIPHFKESHFTPKDIVSFWTVVQARKSDFDQMFAGLYIGMLISAFREKDPDTPIIFNGDIELNNFAKYGKHISHIVVEGNVYGNNCFYAIGVNNRKASDISITGDIKGDFCFCTAGSFGYLSGITIEGSVYGNCCFAHIGSNEGSAKDITIAQDIIGTSCFEFAGLNGSVINVTVDGSIKGNDCFARIGNGGNINDITINGEITGEYCFRDPGFNKGNLSNITFNNSTLKNPTYKNILEALNGS